MSETFSSRDREHAQRRTAAAAVALDPFAHLWVDGLLPTTTYAALRASLPPESAYQSLDSTGGVAPGRYPERLVIPLTEGAEAAFPAAGRALWRDFAAWLRSPAFAEPLVRRFVPVIADRLGRHHGRLSLAPEVFLTRDRPPYALGPHTDVPRKLITALLYLPADDSMKAWGTALYRPRDPSFTCEGGPHYRFELFDTAATMPFVPNALFTFAKTDRSFHGVAALEPMAGDRDIVRDLIIYDLYVPASSGQ